MGSPADVVAFLSEQFLRDKRINHPPEYNETGGARDVRSWRASLLARGQVEPKE
jgi:hypothetical protein